MLELLRTAQSGEVALYRNWTHELVFPTLPSTAVSGFPLRKTKQFGLAVSFFFFFFLSQFVFGSGFRCNDLLTKSKIRHHWQTQNSSVGVTVPAAFCSCLLAAEYTLSRCGEPGLKGLC